MTNQRVNGVLVVGCFPELDIAGEPHAVTIEMRVACCPTYDVCLWVMSDDVMWSSGMRTKHQLQLPSYATDELRTALAADGWTLA